MTAEDPGMLPCRDCGRLVADAHPERLEVTHFVEGGRWVKPYSDPRRLPLGLCSEDRARRELAAATAHKHPNLIFELGTIVFEKLADAWLVADIVGSPISAAEADHASDADLRRDLFALADLGHALRWSARFAPVFYSDRAPSANKRFDYLSDGERDQATRVYADTLKLRIERPEWCAPPGELRGCLACGVATIWVKPSLSRQAWGPERPIIPADAGGPVGPAVFGHCCPACRRWMPALGLGLNIRQPDVERALKAFLGQEQNPLGVDGVVAWAAIPGAKPNAEPWAHLRNVDEIRAALQPAGGLIGWLNTDAR